MSSQDTDPPIVGDEAAPSSDLGPERAFMGELLDAVGEQTAPVQPAAAASASGGMPPSPPPPPPPSAAPPPAAAQPAAGGAIPPRVPKTRAELEQRCLENWVTEHPADEIAEHRSTSIAGISLPTGDGGVVASRPTQAFIEAEKLEAINDALAAAGSLFQMQAVGEPDDGIVTIIPIFDEGGAAVPRGHRFIAELNHARRDDPEWHPPVLEDGPPLEAEAEGPDTAGLVTWADCHKMSQMVMGVKDGKEVLRIPGVGPVEPISKTAALTIPSIKNSEASRMMHTLFGAALPGFADHLTPAEGETVPETIQGVITAVRAAQAAKADQAGDAPLSGRMAYRAIVECGDAEEGTPEYQAYEDFCRIYGVNHHAVPRVGDAFTIVNDEVELKNRKDLIKRSVELPEGERPNPLPHDVWNFHWAGVVAVNEDGSYMTLENTSTEHQQDVNNEWYYAVYDPARGKDFHSVHKKDPAILKNAITLLVTNGART